MSPACSSAAGGHQAVPRQCELAISHCSKQAHDTPAFHFKDMHVTWQKALEHPGSAFQI